MKNVMQKNESKSNRITNEGIDFFECRYYVVNKRILCITGQWPYQAKIERTLRIIVTTILALSLFIPQTIKMVESWGGPINIFVECFSPVLTHIGCFLKMYMGIINTRTLIAILEETRYNWENRPYEAETQILQKYGERGRRYTIGYMIMIFSAVIAWVLTPMMPKFMDLVAPLNQSRPDLILFQTDYLVDPDKYFYHIYFHGSCIVCSSILMLVGIDALYMAMAQHACGMFEILRYRLDNIVQEDAKLKDIMFDPDIREDISYRQIISCIKIHKDIIRYVKLMEASNEWTLVLVLVFSLLVISCSGSMAVTADTGMQDAARFMGLTLAQVVHLFCNTLPGHWILDASTRIRDFSYACRWYMMSRRSRGLVLFLLRRTANPCTIAAGRFYVMSMENFCSVLQTSMSYLTLLTSVQ